MENKTIKQLLFEFIEAESIKRGDGPLAPDYMEQKESDTMVEIVNKVANAWAEQACRKQRELCADAASVELIPILDGGPLSVIEEVKDSILNALLATESNE